MAMPTKPPPILLETLFSPNVGLERISLYDPNDDNLVPSPCSENDTTPWVTLTFAQSLDARIAGEAGKQLLLSGKESMIMTHWMRSMHDAILVGVGTALNDDPQLNTRHLPPMPADSPMKYNLPRPIVLDSHLRLPLGCKLLNNHNLGVGRRPWVASSRPVSEEALDAWTQRKHALESAGAKVIEVESAEGRVSIPSLLTTLRSLGIRSLMVEGGASVIKSFVASSQSQGAVTLGSPRSRTVHALIVTIAPIFVGSGGVGYGDNLMANNIPTMQHIKTELFGPDTVMAFRTS